MSQTIQILILIFTSIALISCWPDSTKTRIEENISSQSTQHSYDSGDVVYQLYTDRSGNLWIATSSEGVYKYDGQTFTNYNSTDGLCGDDVTSIVEDQNGTYWFGTENGLCHMDDGQFETIALPEYNKESDWLDGYYPMINPKAVSSLLQAQSGSLWVGGNCSGVYHYDSSGFQSYLQEAGQLMPDSMHHNSISAIAEDAKGHIWIGSFSHGGVSEYDGHKMIHHALYDGIGDGMISSIYIDRQDVIWVGTRNKGIYRYNGETFVNLAEELGIKEIMMANFLEDSQGRMWIACYARDGVWQFADGKLKRLNIPNSEQLKDVKTMTEDQEGNIWFGGRYGLLWRYDGKSLKNFTHLKRTS